jgi:8-oxo-dGTP pyrophosphatase MutT (NUDIX family)
MSGRSQHPWAACAVIRREEAGGTSSVLLVQSRKRPLYTLPGGKPEAEEGGEQALRREVSEELPHAGPFSFTYVGARDCRTPSDTARRFYLFVTPRYAVNDAAIADVRFGAEIVDTRWESYPLLRNDLTDVTDQILRALIRDGYL